MVTVKEFVSRTAILSLSVIFVALLSTTTAQVGEDDLSFPHDAEWPGEVEKRGSYKAVPFSCNGHDFVPRCQHGGRGPRKTYTRSGTFCVCLCPGKWTGPECGFTVDMYRQGGKRAEDGEEEKRGWDGLDRLQLGKRLTLPWNMRDFEKKNFPWAMKQFEKKSFPWALKQFEKRSMPWSMKTMPGQAGENEVEDFGQGGKRQLPWALKAMPGKKAGWSFNNVPLGKRGAGKSDVDESQGANKE